MDKGKNIVGQEGVLIALLQNHLIDSLVSNGLSIEMIEKDEKTQQWIIAEITALLGMLMDTFDCRGVDVNFLDAQITVQRTESENNRREYVSSQVEQLLDEKPELVNKVTSIFE